MALPGKFLYCFIREKEQVNLSATPLGGSISPVYTIPVRKISAVVSDAELTDYDPTRKNLKAFQKVISGTMEHHTILPVAFGTVARNRADVESMIESNYDDFERLLAYFDDKMEVGLRVTWDDASFHADIEDGEIRQLKDYLNENENRENMSDTIRLGKMVEASISRKREEYQKALIEPLAGLAVEYSLKEQVPIKTVFNAAFLVRKDTCDTFDHRVEELCLPYENKLKFSYTGPWPPYNFINLKLKPQS